MITLLKELLFDAAVARRFGRYIIFLLGAGIQQGIIPTGVNGGGKYGIYISGIALLISSQPKPQQP